jgi:hypothetical protein
MAPSLSTLRATPEAGAAVERAYSLRFTRTDTLVVPSLRNS